jgi:hypothetical protein
MVLERKLDSRTKNNLNIQKCRELDSACNVETGQYRHEED